MAREWHNLADLRKHHNLTLEQVSRKLGISIGNLSRKERGERKLRLHEIRVLADLYHVSTDTIIRLATPANPGSLTIARQGPYVNQHQRR